MSGKSKGTDERYFNAAQCLENQKVLRDTSIVLEVQLIMNQPVVIIVITRSQNKKAIAIEKNI